MSTEIGLFKGRSSGMVTYDQACLLSAMRDFSPDVAEQEL